MRRKIPWEGLISVVAKILPFFAEIHNSFVIFVNLHYQKYLGEKYLVNMEQSIFAKFYNPFFFTTIRNVVVTN